ncbi:hypothetical protein F4813DRAFT_251993 [Daldinia decipiens]|uniref:uncharacterized protein n=1 Tax=Daldinia decipiens TaxID=326647 RepID=UPI0020C1FE25|nr:uncharacterized protein F4813DRAFT_251993 [Daldinia decipiens]KAI1653541.1 hypothetical protein F4813DRAFT_251993 [Daldinia decipiens]
MAVDSQTITKQILDLKSLLNGMNDDEDNKNKFKDKLDSLAQAYINSHIDDYFHETLLHIAARQGHVWAAKTLLGAGASVSGQDYMKCQPLHRACEIGNRPLAQKST